MMLISTQDLYFNKIKKKQNSFSLNLASLLRTQAALDLSKK